MLKAGSNTVFMEYKKLNCYKLFGTTDMHQCHLMLLYLKDKLPFNTFFKQSSSGQYMFVVVFVKLYKMAV